MTEREKKLEKSVRELGLILSELTCGGAFAPRISAALERAREALRHPERKQND